jgi:hypothetical protein
MPAPLGESVGQHLRAQGHSLGPIVVHPRADTASWRFLIRPDLPVTVLLNVTSVRSAGRVRTGACRRLPTAPWSVLGGTRYGQHCRPGRAQRFQPEPQRHSGSLDLRLQTAHGW